MEIVREDWVSRFADEVIAESERRGTAVVCASGISPSGPVHLGNLRELMTPHLVADEVRRRGVPVTHLVSWDDYDRFRRVPSIPGVDASWSEHIGKPLTSVPPPAGSDEDSWAAHFRVAIERSLVDLGVEYRGISQSVEYRAGAYRDRVLDAMRMRNEIDAVLGRYRTLDADAGVASDDDDRDDSGSGEKAIYSPFKPYCTVCGTDFTTVVGYDDATTRLDYVCRCGHRESVLLTEFTDGKLVWKVDWPMRWAVEKVVFEPSGVDHQSPGSSFAVGRDLAPMFGWQRPIGPMYAFVGIQGMAKMSSSRGNVPTPADALRVMEPQLLRWLYARRRPNQSFDIDLGPALARLYDEWDALDGRVARGAAEGVAAPGADAVAWLRASGTASGDLPRTPRPVSFRTLASILDVTTGDETQLLRIVSALDPEHPVLRVGDLRPRLDRVAEWVAALDDADRTLPRDTPADELRDLDDEARAGIALLLDGGDGLPLIEEAWTLDGLTRQVYGVPKVRRGIDADARIKGDAELSAAQRAFFTLLYRLLLDAETGPRLPTLLLALGPERTRTLLGG